jgi:hypothetical protein
VKGKLILSPWFWLPIFCCLSYHLLYVLSGLWWSVFCMGAPYCMAVTHYDAEAQGQ